MMLKFEAQNVYPTGWMRAGDLFHRSRQGTYPFKHTAVPLTFAFKTMLVDYLVGNDQ